MDANIGGSSGGHLAVLLDRTVYHFQFNENQVFSLNREEPEQFYAVYNRLENRSIVATPLRVHAMAVESIKTRLDAYFLVQQKYVRLLALMKQDAEFLNGLSRGQPVSVDHAAYFLPAAQCKAASEHDSIPGGAELFDSKYWADVIGVDLNRARAFEASALPDPFILPPTRVLPDQYPQVPASYSQLLSEQIQADLARVVLQEPHCMGAPFLTTSIEIDPKGRAALEVILEDLRRSARSLLSSERPDRGGALLLTMARIAAVQASLKRNRLTLLDTTPPDHRTGERDALIRLPEYAELAARAKGICTEVLLASVAAEDRSRQLNLLENCATRTFELSRTDSPLVRYYKGNLIPSGRGPVAAVSNLTGTVQDPVENPSALARLSREAGQAYRELESEIQRTYAFNLIAKNCATELLREIILAFPSTEKASSALGGDLYPAASFIPALASFRAGQLQTSQEPQVVLSRRRTMLDKLYESADPFLRPLIYLRESNVVSSTLYTTKEEDTMFLFFTDDALALRPVYGVLNVSYGIVQAGFGCARIPWDGGNRLKSGIRGALFSLPELVFFNIRKGSYPAP
jgi:hypothetical protein